MASIKTLCKAMAWLDRPVASVPTKWFALFRRDALAHVSPQLGDDARACADVDWCDHRCTTAVGVVDGVVFKVAMTLTARRGSSGDLLMAVISCVEQHLGNHPTTAVDGLVIFDADDGNVVVQEIANSATPQIVVYATSTAAATLIPTDQKW